MWPGLLQATNHRAAVCLPYLPCIACIIRTPIPFTGSTVDPAGSRISGTTSASPETARASPGSSPSSSELSSCPPAYWPKPSSNAVSPRCFLFWGSPPSPAFGRPSVNAAWRGGCADVRQYMHQNQDMSQNGTMHPNQDMHRSEQIGAVRKEEHLYIRGVSVETSPHHTRHATPPGLPYSRAVWESIYGHRWDLFSYFIAPPTPLNLQKH